MSTPISNNERKSPFNQNANNNVLEAFLNYNPQKDPLFTQEIPSFDSAFKFFNFECPICLSKITDIFILNNCKHFFCKKCIIKWIKFSKTCPLCRTHI